MVTGNAQATEGIAASGAPGNGDADATSRGFEIRAAVAADWPAIWPFFHTIVTAGETYCYDPAMDERTAREIWMQPPPGHTVVAVDETDAVLGSAKMGANQQGPGAHVATASFMVDPTRSGRGVGRALGEYAVAWARETGFRGMQFNAVAASNTRAVALWRALGFELIGTIPGGFRHPSLGYVGLNVMYRALDS